MTTSAVNGKPLVAADITMPHVGAWHAAMTIDATAALTGRATINIEGHVFVGTFIRSGLHGGIVSGKVVGGNGGLSKELPARNYASSNGAKVRSILGDILEECGEVLSSTSDASLLDTVLQKWERISGPASHAILRLTDEIGATWRVLRDGTVWIGKATWPVASPKFELIDEDWIAGITTIAPQAVDLDPGTTFLGRKITEVVHRLGPSSLRTEACVASPSSALDAFVGYIRRQIDYSRTYPARVSKQNADGTLQVVPDDDKVKGTGLDRVEYDVGLPGAKTLVKPGQRLEFGFRAGDPARPYVSSWSNEGSPLETTLPNGTLPAARQADLTAHTLQLVPAISPAGAPIPNTWCIFLATPPPPPFVPATGGSATFFGAIMSGNPKIKS